MLEKAISAFTSLGKHDPSYPDKLYEEILEYAREKGIPKTRALRELTKEGLKKWS